MMLRARSAWFAAATAMAAAAGLLDGCTTTRRTPTPTDLPAVTDTATPAPSATPSRTPSDTPTATPSATDTVQPPTATPGTPAPCGWLVVAGGYAGSQSRTTVYAAPVLGGGALGAWGARTPLPNDVGLVQGVSEGSYLFVIGGQETNPAGQTLSTVYSASVVAGAVSAWATTSPLPAPRYEAGVVQVGGYAYVAGGGTFVGGFTAHADAFSAQVTGGGSLSAWSTQPSLPANRGLTSMASDASYLYLVAGSDSAFAAASTVYAAPLLGAGVTGPWAATTPFPFTRVGHRCVYDAGNLFVVGGSGAGAGVYVAAASGGVVAGWTPANSPPITAGYPAVVRCGPYLYAIGGTSPGASSAVYVATVVGGTLSTWASTTPLPASFGGSAAGAF